MQFWERSLGPTFWLPRKMFLLERDNNLGATAKRLLFLDFWNKVLKYFCQIFKISKNLIQTLIHYLWSIFLIWYSCNLTSVARFWKQSGRLSVSSEHPPNWSARKLLMCRSVIRIVNQPFLKPANEEGLKLNMSRLSNSARHS